MLKRLLRYTVLNSIVGLHGFDNFIERGIFNTFILFFEVFVNFFIYFSK
jgi:hypothetical protein